MEKKSHFDQVLPKIKKENKQKSVELREVLDSLVQKKFYFKINESYLF